MKTAFYIMPFLVLLFVLSCKNPPTPINRIREELNIKEQSELIKDIPERMKDTSSLFYSKLFNKWEKTLGVPSLENGIDGFQIRIWEGEEDNTGKLFILDYSSDLWASKGYLYKYLSTDETLPDSLDGKPIALKEPKSGWNTFVNKILDKGILRLKDYKTIPNYFMATDAELLRVEIASNRYYRSYELPMVYHQNNKLEDAKKMVEILELIKKDFPQFSSEN